MLRKLGAALSSGATEIVLEQKELEALAADAEPARFPDASETNVREFPQRLAPGCSAVPPGFQPSAVLSELSRVFWTASGLPETGVALRKFSGA